MRGRARDGVNNQEPSSIERRPPRNLAPTLTLPLTGKGIVLGREVHQALKGRGLIFGGRLSRTKDLWVRGSLQEGGKL